VVLDLSDLTFNGIDNVWENATADGGYSGIEIIDITGTGTFSIAGGDLLSLKTGTNTVIVDTTTFNISDATFNSEPALWILGDKGDMVSLNFVNANLISTNTEDFVQLTIEDLGNNLIGTVFVDYDILMGGNFDNLSDDLLIGDENVQNTGDIAVGSVGEDLIMSGPEHDIAFGDTLVWNVIDMDPLTTMDPIQTIRDIVDGDDVTRDAFAADNATEGEADQIFTDHGNDSIFAGGGDDLINAGVGFDNIWGGDGADTFEYASVNEGTDVIFDYDILEGDEVDLTKIFDKDGADPAPDANNLMLSGNLLKVDPTGAGDFTDLVIFNGLVAMDQISVMLNDLTTETLTIL